MKPTNYEIVDCLASEYVLGTLRGPARRRFEQWRAGSSLVDSRCQFWEERLMQLARSIRPIEPPAHVWRAIRKRLNVSPGESARTRARALAIAASVVLVTLGGVLYWRTVVLQRATELATISTPSGVLAWKVEVYARSSGVGRLVVQAGDLPARPVGHDYELWVLQKGGAPVSLGVLPISGISRRDLSPAQQEALTHATQIAVSLEPAGGSPTGLPTGAIVFVAALLS